MNWRGFNYEYFDIKETSVTITGYSLPNMPAELIIPQMIDGKPVVKIEDAAFAEDKKLIRLSLPSSIMVIGESAFRYCRNLQSVYFYNTAHNSAILEVGKRAFCECGNLTKFECETAMAVGELAFKDCRILTEVTNMIVCAGKNSFKSCRNLAELKFGRNASWESNSFTDCKRLNKLYFYHPISRSVLKNMYTMRFLHDKEIFCSSDFNYMDCIYDGEKVVVM